MAQPDDAILKRLRNACRAVADQYDEFGTVYDEALSELYDAEDAFWKAAEGDVAAEPDKAEDRLREAFEDGRAFQAEMEWRKGQ